MADTTPVTIRNPKTLFKFSESANYCAISGEVAIATSRNGSAAAFNLCNGEITVFKEHKSATHQCAISENGRAAATASLDGTVQVWNTSNPGEIWKNLQRTGYERALGVALSRDGTTLAASFESRQNKRGCVSIWKLLHTTNNTEFKKLKSWSVNLDVFKAAIAISDDGSVIAHCARGRVYAMEVISVHTPFRKWRVRGESHVAMSGNADRIVVADNVALRICKMSDGVSEPLTEFELPGYERSFRPFCAMSQDGTRVVAAMVENKFRVWCTDKRAILADITGFGDHTRGCAIHPDGNRLILSSFDNTVRLVNLEDEIDTTDPGHVDSPSDTSALCDFEALQGLIDQDTPSVGEKGYFLPSSISNSQSFEGHKTMTGLAALQDVADSKAPSTGEKGDYIPSSIGAYSSISRSVEETVFDRAVQLDVVDRDATSTGEKGDYLPSVADDSQVIERLNKKISGNCTALLEAVDRNTPSTGENGEYYAAPVGVSSSIVESGEDSLFDRAVQLEVVDHDAPSTGEKGDYLPSVADDTQVIERLDKNILGNRAVLLDAVDHNTPSTVEKGEYLAAPMVAASSIVEAGGEALFDRAVQLEAVSRDAPSTGEKGDYMPVHADDSEVMERSSLQTSRRSAAQQHAIHHGAPSTVEKGCYFPASIKTQVTAHQERQELIGDRADALAARAQKAGVGNLCSTREAQASNDISAAIHDNVYNAGKVEVLRNAFENMSKKYADSQVVKSISNSEKEISGETDINLRPIEVFGNAMKSHGRAQSLLHIHAAEAMKELFSEPDLSTLDKHFIGLTLLNADPNRSWMISETQFVEAATKIKSQIGAMKADTWTKAFVRGAESKTGQLTLPQAAMIVVETAGLDAPDTEVIVRALEQTAFGDSAPAPITVVNLQMFLDALRTLGFEV